MELHAVDTVFYYRVDGELAQKVELEIRLDKPCAGLEVEIDAGAKGRRVTKFAGLEAGGHVLACYAPVVYPNISSGRHEPVPAELAVKADGLTARGAVTLGRFRPWTIYVLQDICSDYTWGMPDDQTKLESYRFSLTHLDEMDRTDGWAEADRHRWNLNQTMEVEWFLERASDADRERFFRRVREGRLQLSATYNANLSSIMPAEQAVRSLYYARELERKYGVAFDTVEHIEMPSMAWGMLELYAGSGIRRFAKNWLNFNSQYLRKSPNQPLFRWKTPDGEEVLSLMPRGANLRFGYAQAEFLSQKDFASAMEDLHCWWIPQYESAADYPYDSFPILGAYGDLHISSKKMVPRLVDAVRRYNDQGWEYPRLVNATWGMYFDAAEKSAGKLGTGLPELSGDFGVSWEDWPIHYAHISSLMKRGIAGTFAAERLAAASAAVSGHTDEARKAILDEAVLAMERLAEHPWNGTNEDEKWRSYEKRSAWAHQIAACNDRLLSSMSGGGELCVYNPVCRPRTDIVILEADAPAGAQGIGEGKAVLAVDAPAIGLARCVPSQKPLGSVKASGTTLENEFYHIEIDRVGGGIASLVDKRTGRQWAEGPGLNSLLYVSDGVPLKAACVGIEVAENGPITAALMVRSSCRRCEVQTTIRLNAANDRIDIQNRLRKEPSGEPLNLYFAFPFAAMQRCYHYEGAAAILRPGQAGRGGDMLPGAGQEIYAVQDFVDLNAGGAGALLCPLDSHMFQFGGNGYELMPDGPQEGGPAVLALCLTNHAYQEILRDQYGNADFLFRFALKTYEGDFDEERAVRFGREAANPLLPLRPADGLSKLAGRPLAEPLTQGVFVTALKPSEELDGAVVLRFWNASTKDTAAVFDISALGMRRAEAVDLLERRSGKALQFDGKEISVPVKGRGFGAILLYK